MKKVVVITGVGKGFGRELAKQISDKYYVVGLSRSNEDLVSLGKELSLKGREFKLLEVDVADFEACTDMLINTLNSISGSVYGLINNAGVRCRKNILELEVEDFVRVSNVNLFAPINLTKALIPRFVESGEGRVINISSILSQGSLPDLSAYSVSKGGLDAFTRSMAVELGGMNIKVNSILPGFCKTSYYPQFSTNSELLEMTLAKTPLKRWGDEDELVGLCRFLLSQDASFITGASIPIDGGWLAQ